MQPNNPLNSGDDPVCNLDTGFFLKDSLTLLKEQAASLLLGGQLCEGLLDCGLLG